MTPRERWIWFLTKLWLSAAWLLVGLVVLWAVHAMLTWYD